MVCFLSTDGWWMDCREDQSREVTLNLHITLVSAMLKINFKPRLLLLSVSAPAIEREQHRKLPSYRALMPSWLVCLKSAAELNVFKLV